MTKEINAWVAVNDAKDRPFISRWRGNYAVFPTRAAAVKHMQDTGGERVRLIKCTISYK